VCDTDAAKVSATSGRDLMTKLGQATPRLLCSLVHKFGRKDVDDFDAFIKELESQPSNTVGEVFVFVDECHRTQSGKLHRVMKAMMPNAVFIGFTGTPLLKKDRQTSLEVFGGYIHTYKFSEAVEDEVVLDLVYEARDIDQRLGSEDKIDAWFEAKTKALNDWQKDELKKKWGTMQNVLSSKVRMDRVVADIIFDFSVKPRLSSERGNAILVASSIYEACKYFTLLHKTPFRGKCAVVTSYNPLAKDVTKEETGANTETDKQFIYNTYNELLKDVEAKHGMNKTETYEERAKTLFVTEPANMKLLVVVDKLLTGFDAPPCTYMYIDKSMQDHGLFQAICRVNRLDGEDKDFGYIVDYKDLFKKVENAIAVYTSELDHSAGGPDPEILLHDRLKKGKEKLDQAIESLIDKIRVFAISKLDWIKRHQCGFLAQERESPREYLDRESHYLWGRRYLLRIHEVAASPEIQLAPGKIHLQVRPHTNVEKKRAVLSEFYREQIRTEAPPLVARWERILGVVADKVYVRQMRTKWGTSNPRARSIRLNTELAKKPKHCLEYIVVHEMVHFLESHHGDRFVSLMDSFMPQWRHYRDELNRHPLAHEHWP
jgi:type I site-specific restriction-modification system R (restriction) subunit